MCFGVPATPCEVRREVEMEGDGYSVYCKRGRREAMEDRFSASVKLQGDSKQVFSWFLAFSFLLFILFDDMFCLLG